MAPLSHTLRSLLPSPTVTNSGRRLAPILAGLGCGALVAGLITIAAPVTRSPADGPDPAAVGIVPPQAPTAPAAVPAEPAPLPGTLSAPRSAPLPGPAPGAPGPAARPGPAPALPVLGDAKGKPEKPVQPEKPLSVGK